MGRRARRVLRVWAPRFPGRGIAGSYAEIPCGPDVEAAQVKTSGTSRLTSARCRHLLEQADSAASALQVITITVRSGAASNRYASAALSRGSRVASWVSK